MTTVVMLKEAAQGKSQNLNVYNWNLGRAEIHAA